MSQAEAEATVRKMEGYGATIYAPVIAPVIAWWREHMQPAVPPVPYGCELVEVDGVPVFRKPDDDDYGWLGRDGGLWLVGHVPLLTTTYAFGGRRYIVRQSVPSDVDRLAQALAAVVGQSWERLSNSNQTYYRVKAQRHYDHGVRCPEIAED